MLGIENVYFNVLLCVLERHILVSVNFQERSLPTQLRW